MRHKRLPPTVIDGRPAVQRRLCGRQPRPQDRQPAGFGEPLRRTGIPAHRPPGPSPRTTRPSWAGADISPGRNPHRPPVPRSRPANQRPGRSGPHAELVLVLARAGDRTGPPRRRHCGHRPLTLGPPQRVRLRSKRPSAIRRASSRRYTEPRYSPITPSASASSSLRCSRVRTRTPAGAAATTGSPMRRNGFPTLYHQFQCRIRSLTENGSSKPCSARITRTWASVTLWPSLIA